MTLAPHWMLPCTHKILEYLVRIYEVHAHVKHTLILSFFAYFETAYFLKAIQLTNIKEDEFFEFLHDFAYKGTLFDKKNMVRALCRNNGVLFSKYATWCFKSEEDLVF